MSHTAEKFMTVTVVSGVITVARSKFTVTISHLNTNVVLTQ